MKKLTLGAIALAASTVIGSAASHATFVGQIFLNDPAASDLSTFTGAGTDGGTFITHAFNFNLQPGSPNTIGAFLDSCTGCNVDTGSANLSASLTNTVIRFT